MGIKIHVNPGDVWDFFDKNLARLAKEMVLIAENEDTDYSIYLTEDQNYPLLSVYKNDLKLYEEGVISRTDCEKTTKGLYTKYLFPLVVTSKDFDSASEEALLFGEPASKQDIEDEIYERSDELYLATIDFLQVLLGYRDPDMLISEYGDITEEFLDSTCEFLSEEYGIPIFRPMFVVDEETGDETYTEFPYMEFNGLRHEDMDEDTPPGWYED